MEATNRRWAGWIAIAVFAVIGTSPTAATGARIGEPVAGASQVIVIDAPPAASRLASWAVGRFAEAGLQLPSTEVRFHADDGGCRGYLGLARAGQVDLCVRLEMEPGPQRLVLHELAHVWAASFIDDECRGRFLELRGLDAWTGDDVAWKQRGTEQAAEVTAWALGDGTMAPMIDGDRDPVVLREAFELLRTGCQPS